MEHVLHVQRLCPAVTVGLNLTCHSPLSHPVYSQLSKLILDRSLIKKGRLTRSRITGIKSECSSVSVFLQFIMDAIYVNIFEKIKQRGHEQGQSCIELLDL